MQEDKKYPRRVAFQTPPAPAWEASDSVEALSIQVAPAKRRGDFLTRDGNDEELALEGPDDDQEMVHRGAFEPDAISGDEVECSLRRPSRPGPFFPSKHAEETYAPHRLSKKVRSSGGPTWLVSAPEIEQAIRALLGKLNRTPTDDEIAQEIGLSVAHYHEALTLLKDIERQMALKDFQPTDNSAATGMVVSSGGLDSAVFCCLRSEMIELFANAVKVLPERERLVVSLRYCENMNDMELLLTLNIEESSLTRLTASALLHLRARIFGSNEADHYRCGGRVRPANSEQKWSETQAGREAQVYLYGGQSGWLPMGQSWEHLDEDARYDHFAQTWFSVNEDGQLSVVQRVERYELHLNDCRRKSGA